MSSQLPRSVLLPQPARISPFWPGVGEDARVEPVAVWTPVVLFSGKRADFERSPRGLQDAPTPAPWRGPTPEIQGTKREGSSGPIYF